MSEDVSLTLLAMTTVPILDYLWRAYLLTRQSKVCKSHSTVPPDLQNVLSAEIFTHMREHTIKMIWYWIYSNAYDIIVSSLIVYFGIYSKIWHFVESNTHWKSNELINFIWLCAMANFSIISYLPVSFYEFYILGEYELFIENLTTKILYVPVIFLASLIIKLGGDYFFFYYWIFSSVTFFIFEPVRKQHINSLFGRIVLLQNVTLQTEIENVCKDVDFPLRAILIAEGLRSSVHLTYIAYGKDIVIHDNLLDQFFPFEIDEVVALVAHQLAHWKLNHFGYKLIVGEIWLLVTLSVYSMIFHNISIYKAVGFDIESPIVPVGLVLLQNLMTPVYAVLSFIRNGMYRSMEYSADRFVKQLDKGPALSKALVKLHRGKYQFPITDSLYSKWFSHRPTFMDRKAALDC